MSKPLRFKTMLEPIKEALDKLPEHRTGRNSQYALRDAGLSALSVFYMQSPSFLSWQQDMEKKRGKNNARSLFGIEGIPSDEQIKVLRIVPRLRSEDDAPAGRLTNNEDWV